MGECRSRKSSRLVVAIGLMIFAAGCRSASPRTGQTGVLHDPRDVKVNREQLRLRVRSLVGPMTGRMESAADEIAASTASQTVRLAALEWKIEAVPAMRDSLFQPDPYVALVDAWVLLYQMSDYFERGPGKTRLGRRAHWQPRRAERQRTILREWPLRPRRQAMCRRCASSSGSGQPSIPLPERSLPGSPSSASMSKTPYRTL